MNVPNAAIWTAALTLCLIMPATAADNDTLAVYTVTTTVDAQLTLPAPDAEGRHLWRNKQGAWQDLKGETDEQRLRFRLRVEDMLDGRTMVVLNCPPGLDLEDRTPPSVVRLAVNGEPRQVTESLDLGSVAEPPKTIAITFRDEKNILVKDSLTVLAGGTTHRIDDPGVLWHADTLKQGTVMVSLDDLFAAPPDGRVTVTVSMDDAALDREEATCSISFTYTAPHLLEDGRLLAVDSVTDSAGWAEWWVITDGVKMDESISTTAGYTWLSQPTDGPHWVQITFPTPRNVDTVRLWWAYYQTYRTSTAYRVQVMPPDGNWKTVAEVSDQPEKQVSVHQFEPTLAKAVRVWQPPLSGQRERTEYMWLSEIEVD